MQAAPPLHTVNPVNPVNQAPDFDAPLNLQIEREIEAKREAAYTAPLIWQGRQLQPWSLLRHAMHRRLMQHLCPVPHHLWGEDLEAHAPDAMLFLWLANQSDTFIVQLAGQPVALWLAVFGWAEKSLARESWPAAIDLMTSTFELGKITEVRVREAEGRINAGEPVPSPPQKPPSSPCSVPRATAPRKKSPGAGRYRK
jgi:hypothetical protein